MTEDPPVSFAGLLRRLRTEVGLTQEKLADAAGVSPRTVSDLERDVNHSARRDTARLLADALGLAGADRQRFEAVARRPAGPGDHLAQEDRRRTVAAVERPSGAGQAVVGEVPREPPGFVVRETVTLLREAAGRGRVAVVCAVTGLRGVGKTQVAAAYARIRIADGWSLVGWVNAETTGSLLAGLARVAERLGLAEREGDSAESAARLREYLNSRTSPGLLIFDNVVDIDGLRPYLPAAGGTQIVITSTDRRLAEVGIAVDVAEFTRAESVGFLTDRTGLADEAGADSVAAALGDLPLGLAQAAAAIRGQYLTYQVYLERLSGVPVTGLLGRIPGGDYPHATAAALLLSVQEAELTDPLGLTGLVLRTVATLSPDGVGRDLLSKLAGRGYGGEVKPQDVGSVLERCVASSLLSWSVAGDAVIMHRLLSRVLRERDQAAGRWDDTVRMTLDLLEPQLFGDVAAWRRRVEGADLVAQVEALSEAITDYRSPGSALRLQRARCWGVRQLTAVADLSRAINLGVQAMADSERILGADHPQTVIARDDLAVAYRAAGRLGEAIPIFEAVLADWERIQGSDVPGALMVRNSLATAYEAAGHLGGAIPLLEGIVGYARTSMSDADPQSLTWRNNLAYAYRAAGRIADAIALYTQIVSDCERVIGDDHPQTLTVQNNLAFAYRAAGRLAAATELLTRTLADRERVLGLDHPQTLTSRNDLAGTYHVAGRLAEAIGLYQSTIADWIRVLGPEQLDTLTSRNDLACTMESAGRLKEAVALLEANLADGERVLGRTHPIVLSSGNNLAHAYLSAGRLTEATELYERTLKAREQALGSDHPQILASRSSLAFARGLANRHFEAIEMLTVNLADCERTLGADNPQVLVCRNHLGTAVALAGLAARSQAQFEVNLAECTRVLDADHPSIFAARNNLACAYLLAERTDAAIALFETNLSACLLTLTEDHPHVVALRNNLACAYEFAGRRGDAVTMFESNLSACLQVLDDDHPSTLAARDNLQRARSGAGLSWAAS